MFLNDSKFIDISSKYLPKYPNIGENWLTMIIPWGNIMYFNPSKMTLSGGLWMFILIFGGFDFSQFLYTHTGSHYDEYFLRPCKIIQKHQKHQKYQCFTWKTSFLNIKHLKNKLMGFKHILNYVKKYFRSFLKEKSAKSAQKRPIYGIFVQKWWFLTDLTFLDGFYSLLFKLSLFFYWNAISCKTQKTPIKLKLWWNVILNEPKLQVKSILSHWMITKTCFHKNK